MNNPCHTAPILYGHIAEAIAAHALGPEARWIGGRNPGYDIVLNGAKIDVKSGVRQPNRMTGDADEELCIGIRLNKGIEGLANQDVDEIVIVVRDHYPESESQVVMRGDSAQVNLSVKISGVAVYRLPIEAVGKHFKQPYKRDGSRRASIHNVDAPIKEIEKYRIAVV